MFGKMRGPTSAHRVELPLFEGPLDLLLHLVDKEELDITEVSLATVAGQYQSYLENLQQLDLEVESSWIVVFAQLLELKSRLLLPEPPPELEMLESENPDEEGESNDLVARLREYKLMKQLSDWLGEREQQSCARYPHPSGLQEPDQFMLNVSMGSLHAAALRLLKPTKPFKPPPTFKKMELSVPERVEQIWNFLVGRPKALFRQLLGKKPSKSLVVVTFLAILELARHDRVRLHQESFHSDIEIEPRENRN